MDQLRAIRTLIDVVDEGGFAAAARLRDLAPSVVTRLVAELEDDHGVRLLNRTTRSLRLTDAGERYVERMRQLLIELDEADAELRADSAKPTGHLRIKAPIIAATYLLAPYLPEFHERYPDVTLEIEDSGRIESVDPEFDLTVLLSRQPMNGDFVARRIGCSQGVLCASPGYLARKGRPKRPEDLLSHDAMLPARGELARGAVFTRTQRGGKIESVHVEAPRAVLSTQHADIMRAMAIQGLGIAGLPHFVAHDALDSGALERLLPEWQVFDVELWVAMPSRRHLPARTRVFLDFLVQKAEAHHAHHPATFRHAARRPPRATPRG